MAIFQKHKFKREEHVYVNNEFSELLKDAVRFFHGTPVLTFDSGGSPECINKKSGSVVSCDDINELIKEIERIRNERPFMKENCILRAEEFDADKKFKEYTELYK